MGRSRSSFFNVHSRHHSGCLQADAEKFYELVEKLNGLNKEKPVTDELNKHWIKLFSKTCTGDLCPMQAVIGGIAAQEAMKVRKRRETFGVR